MNYKEPNNISIGFLKIEKLILKLEKKNVQELLGIVINNT